jgi:hypothetical protein
MKSLVKTENVCACSRRIPDEGTLCWTCTETVEVHLGQLVALVGDLEVTRTRQARLGLGGPRGKGSELPLMWHEGASRAIDLLAQDVAGWVDRLAQVEGEGLVRDLKLLCASMAKIRLANWAPEMARGVETHTARAMRVLDRPEEVRYLGPCPGAGCGEDLYVLEHDEWVRCGACSEMWNVEERRADVLGQLGDVLVGAKALAEVLTGMTGEKVSHDRVRVWASRGRILAHGHDRKGRPVYRVGDGVALLAARRRTAA